MILSECDACGKEHKGIFYQCTTCPNNLIHSDCLFLLEKLLIQHTISNCFSHIHPLTLAYFLLKVDQKAKFEGVGYVMVLSWWETLDIQMREMSIFCSSRLCHIKRWTIHVHLNVSRWIHQIVFGKTAPKCNFFRGNLNGCPSKKLGVKRDNYNEVDLFLIVYNIFCFSF